MAERVPIEPVAVVAHLAATDLFSLLPPDALARLAPLFSAVRYGPGQLIARQGFVDATLWAVTEGQVSMDRRAEDGVVAHMAFRGYGTVVGEAGVFTGEPRDSNVITVEPTTLIYADREDIWAALAADPELYDRLVLGDDVRKRLSMFDLSAAMEGEYQVALYRRHWIALVQRMLMPLALLVVCLGGAAVLAALSSFTPSASPALILILAAIGLGIPILGGIWAYFDYYYDCLIVTSRRIVHVERTPFMDTSRTEALLSSIQDVSRVTPGVGARLLKYGTVTVQTASTGGAITFDRVPHPQEVRETVFVQIDRAKEHARRERQAWITRQVRRAIGQETGEDGPEFGAITEVEAESAEAFLPLIFEAVVTAISYFWPKTRVQEGDLVTWRKHWWFLVRSAVVPVLLLALLTAGAYYVWWALGDLPWLIVVPLWLALVGWLLWRYEDWRNDLYQLTNDHVIDIERKPLGFFEERKQASLDQIQDVRYVVPNPVATLLDFGSVMIETAAEIGNFTFDYVYHPSSVQEEIFSRIDRHHIDQQREEEDRRATEMSRWIGTYHRVTGEGEARPAEGRPPAPPIPPGPVT